jgi:hypothetical protein
VPLVYNISTQHISPQFHVIFDDEFSTGPALTSIVEQDDTFERLFETSCERFLDEDDLAQVPDLQVDDDGDVIEGSGDLLDDEWLTPSQLLHRNERRPRPAMTEDEAPEGVQASERARTASEGVQTAAGSRPIRHAREATWKEWPISSRLSKKSLLANLLLLPQMALSAIHNTQPPPAVANIPGPHGKHAQKRILLTQLDEAALLSSDWSDMGNRISSSFGHCFSAYVKPDLWQTKWALLPSQIWSLTSSRQSSTLTQTNLPIDRQSTALKPTCGGMHNGSGIGHLGECLKVWDLVYREAGMNILPSTWAFKLKRFPDGLAKKFKARFRARGDRQKFGIDYFDPGCPMDYGSFDAHSCYEAESPFNTSRHHSCFRPCGLRRPTRLC